MSPSHHLPKKAQQVINMIIHRRRDTSEERRMRRQTIPEAEAEECSNNFCEEEQVSFHLSAIERLFPWVYEDVFFQAASCCARIFALWACKRLFTAMNQLVPFHVAGHSIWVVALIAVVFFFFKLARSCWCWDLVTQKLRILLDWTPSHMQL